MCICNRYYNRTYKLNKSKLRCSRICEN